jgi:hypothetical protein
MMVHLPPSKPKVVVHAHPGDSWCQSGYGERNRDHYDVHTRDD